jgi:galactokinase
MSAPAIDEMRIHYLVGAHRQTFGETPILLARAPGRINLIGEHTDYNDGFVLPAAIDRDTLIVASPRPGRQIRAQSLNIEGLAELDLDKLRPGKAWHDYVAGVAAKLENSHYVQGCDLTIASTIPLGGGLSSSAALEVATALALTAFMGQDFAPKHLALLCQKAEQDFVGANVGVMDQFISLFGQPDHALFLDCRSLATEAIPLPLAEAGLALVVCDSGVKHAIAGGEYNKRRKECAEAVRVLSATYPHVTSLRDATPKLLEQAWGSFGGRNAIAGQRARHVVSENARVQATVEALKRGDWAAVGDALWSSHASLRDDYEVSIPEIDALVEIARGVEGVLGSRLMGGGFGGSTLTLLQRGAVPAFTDAIHSGYREQFGREATVIPVEIVGGAGVWELARGNDEE